MAPVATAAFSQWRSPPPPATPALEPESLPAGNILSPGLNAKIDLLHPSFLPPCEHAKDGGEMHAHAFDLLSLAGGRSSSGKGNAVEPSSVPATSYLTTTRPSAVTAGSNGANGAAAAAATPAAAPTKARRMSSSTTGVLGRGKLGLTGDSGLTAQPRPSLVSHTSTGSPIPGRRLSNAAAGPPPQLFDFTKTDRRPSAQRSNSRGVAASLPSRGIAGAAARVQPPPAVQTDDMELDMAFDGDDDDERSGGRSGSAELDMDMEDDAAMGNEPDWEKLALGTGSGGIKGRRKGMVFKCENCAKEYRHPSCLIKHRWEHSPHWREPTQISMSKHQQVQMLEAAAILAHLDPTANAGRSLPSDKSLWPAILSPAGENAQLLRSARSQARDLPGVRSPPSSHAAPLTPSSLREVANFGSKPRKSSPGSDSTSSLGGGGSDALLQGSPNPSALGFKPNGTSPHPRAMGINDPGRRSSVSSSVPGPTTPHSIGSLPDMNGLHFHTGSTPTGTSPIPHRGGLPLSLGARASMIGNGMFGAGRPGFKVPDSGLRGGVAEDDEDDLEYGLGGLRRGKSSSEEADERRRDDENGFEIDNMEL